MLFLFNLTMFYSSLNFMKILKKLFSDVKRFIKNHLALLAFWAIVGLWLSVLLAVAFLSSPSSAQSGARAGVVPSENGNGLEVYSGTFFGPDGSCDFTAEYYHRNGGKEEGEINVLSRDGIIYICCSGDTAFALADELCYYENLSFLGDAIAHHLLRQSKISD